MGSEGVFRAEDGPRLRHRVGARGPIEPVIGEVTLRGRAYRYADVGAGPPLLLLHGWNGSWENFRSWFETLSPLFRLIVPDLPGCGAPRLEGAHTAADHADWAHELIGALGIGPAIVGGLCSGATIAMALDARHREDVTALLLHTPLYHREVLHPALLAQLRLYSLPFAGPLVDRLRRNARLVGLYRRIFTNGGDVPSEEDALNQRDLERADLAVGRELLLDVLRADHRVALRDPRRPIFVILAAADAFLRADAARRLAALAPHARIAIVEGGGHGWTAAYVARQSALLAEFARSQAR